MSRQSDVTALEALRLYTGQIMGSNSECRLDCWSLVFWYFKPDQTETGQNVVKQILLAGGPL